MDVCERGSQLRPHLVWFGEMVPAMDEAVEAVAGVRGGCQARDGRWTRGCQERLATAIQGPPERWRRI